MRGAKRFATTLAVATGLVAIVSAAAAQPAVAGSGSIVGRVVDGCGRPVVGADLAVARTRPVVDVPLIGIRTNARGRYNYSPLQPARYWITVRAHGFRPQTRTVVLRAGGRSRLNFRFRRCAPPTLAG